MKPFLGIDLTQDKKNERLNGDVFITARPCAASVQNLTAAAEKANNKNNEAKLPLAIRIGQGICGVIAFMVVMGTLRSLRNVSLEEGYHNAPWLFWLGGGCLVVWLLLRAIAAKKQKTVLSTEESNRLFANVESICQSIYTELGVPSNAKEVDLLSFYYKEKDGNIKPKQTGMQMVPYNNQAFRCYADTENLYIVDIEGKYTFPLAQMRAIHTVNAAIGFPNWNKKQATDEGIYKKYKITIDNNGCLHCKPFHILELRHGGETWGIYFPCYELPVIESLTGLKAQ